MPSHTASNFRENQRSGFDSPNAIRKHASQSKSVKVAACRECGVVLEVPDRKICDECLPDVDRARTEKLIRSGTSVLAAMRASGNDPAKSPEAIAKRSATLKRVWAEQKAWERANPGPHDPEGYWREILPGLGKAPVAEIAKATGLSKVSAGNIRSGRHMPHPRHWEVLRELAI